MDVVDLHDFVQRFPGKKTMARPLVAKSEPLGKLKDTLDSNSSIALPLPAQMLDNGQASDIERMVTQKSEAPATTTAQAVTALDWTGLDDPENPENWSTGKKAYHVACIGLQCFVM